MNTAIRVRTVESDIVELELLAGPGSRTLATEKKEKKAQASVFGKNARRLEMILKYEPEQTDVFELFGWGDLPDSIKSAIRPDMESYRDELMGLYSTCEQGVRDRRKSVSYWVKAWRDGVCSEQTAAESLSASIYI